MKNYQYIIPTIIAIFLIFGFHYLNKDRDLDTEAPPSIPQSEILPGTYISSTDYVDFEDYLEAQEEIEILRDELGRLRYELVGHNRTTATGQGRTTEVIVTQPGQTVTPVEDELTVQFQDTEVPVGSISLAQNGTLSYVSYDLDLMVDTYIVGTDYDSITTVTRVRLTANGEEYLLPVNSRTTIDERLRINTSITETPLKRFHFSPNVTLGVGLGVPMESPRIAPCASLGLEALYLRNQQGQDEWSFVNLGLGLQDLKNPSLYLVPASYNLGLPIPFISDFWIGPSIQWSPSQQWVFGLGFHTRL